MKNIFFLSVFYLKRLKTSQLQQEEEWKREKICNRERADFHISYSSFMTKLSPHIFFQKQNKNKIAKTFKRRERKKSETVSILCDLCLKLISLDFTREEEEEEDFNRNWIEDDLNNKQSLTILKLVHKKTLLFFILIFFFYRIIKIHLKQVKEERRRKLSI